MPPLSRHRSLALLISLLAAAIFMADGAGPSDLQHKIRAFETDIPIPLDGVLGRCLTAWYLHPNISEYSQFKWNA
jgi:hypothetical protein